MGEVALKEEFPVQTSKHEVFIKFPRAKEGLIIELLQNHSFVGVKVIRRDGYCFAHCMFDGDIRELDIQLKDLKSEALLNIGKREEDKSIFLEFFLPSGDFWPADHMAGPDRKKKVANLIYTVAFLVLAFVYGIIFNSYLPITNMAASLTASSSSSLSAESVIDIPVVPADWEEYIFPKYQLAWWEIKSELMLDESIMVQLFKQIKFTGDEGQGRIHNDLTLRPKTVRRALFLIIQSEVKDLEHFQEFLKELRGLQQHLMAFPDHRSDVCAPRENFTDNSVILTFCESVLRDHDFASSLLDNIWKGQKRKEGR
jgi:hypothetical protein